MILEASFLSFLDQSSIDSHLRILRQSLLWKKARHWISKINFQPLGSFWLLQEDVNLETVDKFILKSFSSYGGLNSMIVPLKAAPLPAPSHKPWPNVSGAPLAAWKAWTRLGWSGLLWAAFSTRWCFFVSYCALKLDLSNLYTRSYFLSFTLAKLHSRG